MIDIQYSITIMGGREVSRPYRVVWGIYKKKAAFHLVENSFKLFFLLIAKIMP